jgi:hypothetical protein
VIEEGSMVKRLGRAAAMLAALLAPAALPAREPAVLGHAALERPDLEEEGVVLEWSLSDPGLVTTRLSPAIVHLDNGRVLRLDLGSAVYLRSASDGVVEMAVRAGRVSTSTSWGRTVSAGAGSIVVLRPPSTNDPEDPQRRPPAAEVEPRPGAVRSRP